MARIRCRGCQTIIDEDEAARGKQILATYIFPREVVQDWQPRCLACIRKIVVGGGAEKQITDAAVKEELRLL